MGLITFMSYQMMQGMFPNESEHYNVSRDTSSYHRADSNMHLKKKKNLNRGGGNCEAGRSQGRKGNM